MNLENFMHLLPGIFYFLGIALLCGLMWRLIKDIRKLSKRLDATHERIDYVLKDLHKIDMRLTINEVRMEERRVQTLLPAPVKRGRKPKIQ